MNSVLERCAELGGGYSGSHIVKGMRLLEQQIEAEKAKVGQEQDAKM